MKKDILYLMDQRRKAKGDKAKYERLNNEVKKRCNEAKEEWLEDKCCEIEISRRGDSKAMYRNIEEITGRKRTCTSTGCLKAKDGTIIMDKKEILNRWAEYIQELFEDADRKDDFTIKKKPILKDLPSWRTKLRRQSTK